MIDIQPYQTTNIIPPSKEFALFMINPNDKSDLGIFLFFNSIIGFKEKLIIAFQVFNPDGDFIEFKSKLQKFLIGKSELDFDLRIKDPLEELLNIYSAIQFFGKTEELATSQDDFSKSMRSSFLPLEEDEKNDSDGQLPVESYEPFFKWVFNYPACLFE